MRRYEISDQQWVKIASLLPGKVGDVGRSAIDNRLFINAVLWIARSGAPWRDLPERFGPWKRSGVPVSLSPISPLGQRKCLVNRFRSLARARFRLADDRLNDSPGSSTRSRPKKSEPASECLGQSVGGWSTKIHALVDALGNPLRIILSVGQRADITQAEPLLTDYPSIAVLADHGYDADALLTYLKASGTQVVIPAKKNLLESRSIDENIYGPQ